MQLSSLHKFFVFSSTQGRVTFSVWIILVIFLSIFIAFSCSNPPKSKPTFRGQMHEANAALLAIYEYIWGTSSFRTEEGRKEIISALERLSEKFHDLDSIPENFKRDPGFIIALAEETRLLEEVRLDVMEGSEEYARWRLKGLAANCVSCHVRVSTDVTYPGQVPVMLERTPKLGIEYAEFLVASRNFERASAVLRDIIEGILESGYEIPELLYALKLRLLVETRVGNQYSKMANWLDELPAINVISSAMREYLTSWATDLRANQGFKGVGEELLNEAELLLDGIQGNRRLDVAERNLVKSLLAGKYLHAFLIRPKTKEGKKLALSLLAEAYMQTPISLFDVYPERYLARLIKEFSGTEEAKYAYERYEERVIGYNSGSSGLHLDDETRKNLSCLRFFAFELQGSKDQNMIDYCSLP